MSETAEVTVNETPVTITIVGDTPIITIHDNTPQVSIYDNSTSITTTINAVPEVTIEAETNITLTADEEPRVIVNTGAGTPYDESTLLSMLAGKLTYSQLDTSLQADITHNRDMWNRIGNEIVLLYQDGVDITEANQTYTDTEISSSVIDLHVTIAGEIDAEIAVVTQTADALSQTVTNLQQDVDGNFTLQQTQIVQNASGITSTVTRLESLDGPTGLVTQHTSQIAQNADNITLEIADREELGDEVTANYAEIVLNTTNISLQVSQISSVENRMDTAESNITAQGIINSVNSTLLGEHEYSIEAVETLLANQWSLNIAEDVGGNKYSTGFQLMLHPVWLVDQAYVIDDTIFYDEAVWVCILGHTSATTNNPDGVDGATYWSEVVGGYHSEFTVEAEKFQVSVPTESAPVAVFTVTGGTVRIDGTLITDTLEALTAYIEMSIQSSNYEEGVIGWRLDKSGTFDIYGGVATFGKGVLPALPADEHLVGYWSFDEGDGAAVKDSSLEGNDGTLAGTYTWVPGISGPAIDFGAAGGICSCGTDPSLQSVGDRSFTFWYTYQDTFPQSGGGVPVICGNETGSVSGEILYINATGKLVYRTSQAGTSEQLSADTSIVPQVRVFLGISVISGVVTFFINGSPDGGGSITAPVAATAAFYISMNHADYGAKGILDELRAYDVGLTPNEHQALYLTPGGNKAPIPGATNNKAWEHSTDTTKIDGGEIYAGSSITIGGVGATDDYCYIDAGDITFYQYLSGAYRNVKSLKRIEIGVAENGVTELISGHWANPPEIMISPSSLQCFDATYPTQDQTLQFAAPNVVLQTSKTSEYEFTPLAQLIIATSTESESPGTTASGDDTGPPYPEVVTVTTASYTSLPSNCRQITSCSISAKAKYSTFASSDRTAWWSMQIKVRLEWYDGTWHYGSWSSIKTSADALQTWTVASSVATSDITAVRVSVTTIAEVSLYLYEAGSPADARTYATVNFNSFIAQIAGATVLASGTLNYLALGE